MNEHLPPTPYIRAYFGFLTNKSLIFQGRDDRRVSLNSGRLNELAVAKRNLERRR